MPLRGFRLRVPFLPGNGHASDPVKDLQQILQERPNFRDKDQMTAYQKNLDKRVEAIKRPGDLRRAERLRELADAMNMPPQPGGPEEENAFFEKMFQNCAGQTDKASAKGVARRSPGEGFGTTLGGDHLPR